MRSTLGTTLLALCTVQLTVVAGAQAQNPVSNGVRYIAQRQTKNIVDAAEEMPADKYGYKPTPAQMSFGDVVAHLIREGNNYLCGASSGMKGARDRQVRRNGLQGKARGRPQGLVQVLRDRAGRDPGRAVGRQHRLLRRQEADEGLCRVDHRRRLGGPLQPDGDLPAAERAAAADGEESRLAVAEDLPRRVVSARPHDAAARVRRRAAEVQPFDGRAVVGVSGQRPQAEELRQRHAPREDVPAREPEAAL